MQKEEIQDLVKKYWNDTATTEELRRLSEWYKVIPTEEVEWMAEFNHEEELLKLSMFNYIQDQKMQAPYLPQKHRINRNSYLVWTAAAAILLIIGTVLFYYSSNTSFINHKALYANDIAPGKNTATLTLANGKTINLSDAKTGVIINAVNDAAKLTYNDGTSLLDPSASLRDSPQLLTAATPRGGQYTVTLPDGTKVWLNAASSIKFPLSFAGAAQRKIQLVGEAYFEVFKDKKHPFKVFTKGQEVEVLGTHFNINSYDDETTIKTTLLEGSVRVSALNNRTALIPGQEMVLKPGEQSVLKGTDLQVKQVDPVVFIAWKEGTFRFQKEPLESIMKKLSRWYNIEVSYAREDVKQEPFGGIVSRNSNISEVLQMLERTGAVKFTINGNKVTVQ